MKMFKLCRVLLLAPVCILSTACVPQEFESNIKAIQSKATNTANNRFTAALTKTTSETNAPPSKVKLREVNNLGKEPKIFYYTSNSDYVVVALLDTKEYVGKVEKKNQFSLEDNVAGILYSFRVEKTLCSKGSFSPTGKNQTNSLADFQMFTGVASPDERYNKGQRYLLFLRQIPKEENLAAIYELDKEKKYFRAFNGERSIFSDGGGGFHSPPTKGIIEMSNSKYQDLIEKIETFCLAVNQAELKTRLTNLQNLAASPDEEIKSNAVYAIKVLQSPD